MLTRLVWIATSVFLLAAIAAQAQQPAAASLPALDYDVYKTRVQPILMAMRDGHARCILCHVTAPGVFGGSMRLQPFAPGTTTWTEEQSRRNFDAVRRIAGTNPATSPLLLMPLAEEAGGTPFHSGGKHFDSRNDAEWQTLAAWVRGQTPPTASR
jgi:hypothetical protein